MRDDFCKSQTHRDMARLYTQVERSWSDMMQPNQPFNLKGHLMDAIETFKSVQKQGWPHFAPLEAVTSRPAAHLARHARIRAGQRVLDVACGTGVVAVTAARIGCHVTGLDLTPELLEHARRNARIAGVEIDWHEGDVEQLPFDAGVFDAVLSQYGHIFAPRPAVALAEMLRVLKPGGTIAFSTWPPELFVGRMFTLIGGYMPPPPPGVSPPWQWGDPNVVRERFGSAVKDIVFARDMFPVPALSPRHHRETTERTAAPILKLVESLTASNPARLSEFRTEYDALAAEYFDDNAVRQDYLLTRATKI
jgi:SAM-dependent methyltransferase